MSQKRIAIYGGSLNPPHLGHVEVVRALANVFDEVIVVPCGPRPDKRVTNDLAPSHRATMADLAFGGIPKVEVDLFDLDRDVFTSNVEFEARYMPRGEVHHVVGADLICKDGVCAIRDRWRNGESLWNTARFVVVKRDGYCVGPEVLPPFSMELDVALSCSSTDVRKKAFEREPFEHLVPPKVAAYIRRYGLYRISMPSQTSCVSLDNPAVAVRADEWNTRALEMSESLALKRSEDPDLIMVFGGDGTMLRAIRTEWRRRIPFYGVNFGNVGFLLNESHSFTERSFRNLVVHRVPLLDVEMRTADGQTVRALACNDAWVHSLEQTAWVRVMVDDIVWTERMVADAVLVATPAGSTAYAFDMGATPMLLDQRGLVLAATAVNRPFGWRPMHLPESVVTLTAVHSEKRPIAGKVDGQSYGAITSMRIRVSRTASAELAFNSGADLNEKRIAMQFRGR